MFKESHFILLMLFYLRYGVPFKSIGKLYSTNVLYAYKPLRVNIVQVKTIVLKKITLTHSSFYGLAEYSLHATQK